MAILTNLINHLLPFTTQSKIKTALFSVFNHQAICDKLLEQSNVINNASGGNRDNCSKGDARKLPSPEDDVIGPSVPILKFYRNFSTFGHVLNILVASTLIYYRQSRVLKANSGQIPTILCHMPRFLLHPILKAEYMPWLSCTFSFVLLAWRGLMSLYQRNLRLDALTYLMIDDKVVEAQSQPYPALRSCINHQQLDLAQRLIFYRVEADKFNYFALCVRPNRTPEARAQLLKIVHKVFQLTSISLFSIILSFIPVSIWTAFYRFDMFYMGCDPPDSLWNAACKILGSITLSSLMIIDCFGADFNALFLDILLISDLKIYWTKIELELYELSRLMREQQQKDARMPTREVDIGKGKLESRRRLIKSLETFNYISSIQQRKKKQPLKVELCNIGSLNYLTECNGTSRFKERIYVLQVVMCDFFVKLREVDEYMSLALGMTLLIWLASNSVMSYIGLQMNTSASTLFIRVFQLVMGLIYCIFSAFILHLKQSIDLAYKTLSSITAHDTSLEKRRWLLLLDYYTGKLRHSFTLFHSSVFTLLIFLQSISYTITFSIYMYSIRVRSLE